MVIGRKANLFSCRFFECHSSSCGIRTLHTSRCFRSLRFGSENRRCVKLHVLCKEISRVILK